jgi:hypothetical protein
MLHCTRRRACALLCAFHHVRGGFSTRSRDARARNNCIASFLALHNWKRVNPHTRARPRSGCAGGRARRRRARASGSGLHGSSPRPSRAGTGPDLLGACLRGRRGPEFTDHSSPSGTPRRPRFLVARSRPASDRAVWRPLSVFEMAFAEKSRNSGNLRPWTTSFEGCGHILPAPPPTCRRREEHPVRDSNP